VFVQSAEERQAVQELLQLGLNDGEISRRIGVHRRWMNQWNLSVAKRASVARLDEFIGPKR